MQSPQNQGSDGAALGRLWLQVCAARGTPAPDAAQLAGFIAQLGSPEREKLQSVLTLAARGREEPGGLSLLSWAATCTRPALLSQLQNHGLAFSSAELFACGLALTEQGWDMQPRLAQLASCPEDVAALRAWLAGAAARAPGQPQVHLQDKSASPPAEEAVVQEAYEEAYEEAYFAWLGDDRNDPPQGSHAPGWAGKAMEDAPPAPASSRGETAPSLPTRFERQRPEPLPGASDPAKAERPMRESQLRLRLFGKSAAHTLEVTPHRRGGDFLGVHVVSIDSARALGSGPGAGYDWPRKLVLQLTPEEMPAVIATLMGLAPSVRFGHHGAERSKFVELRRQEGGLVIVTGEKSLSYSVPVPTASAYYVLELFCRAMCMSRQFDKPGLSVADVLRLVKSSHGF